MLTKLDLCNQENGGNITYLGMRPACSKAEQQISTVKPRKEYDMSLSLYDAHKQTSKDFSTVADVARVLKKIFQRWEYAFFGT